MPASEGRKRMLIALERMHHRGPDESGTISQKEWVIGHSRLSIIDLESSKQPMHDEQNRYFFSFNGEIYNFQELRKTLESSWRFHTAGDTEVVLAGLITMGPNFLRRMQGMWAFCLWDSYTNKLLFARDRIGKKPLYFRANPHGIACASELNGLKALVPTIGSEDPDSVADFFRYGFFLPGTTIYHNTHEVLPGHLYSWTPAGGIQKQPFWDLSIQPYNGSIEEARQILRDKLIRAVQRRLVSDVEVGAFLSGGIDSSLVLGIMSNILQLQPKTFTVGFTEKTFDERHYAALVAKYYHSQHFESCITMDNPEQLSELVLTHVGQPFTDTSLLPTSQVAGLASNHVKVALSGDGADEIFSGYQRYQARVLLRWYTRLPKIMRRNIHQVLRAIPEPMAHHSHSLLKKMHLFFEIEERHQDGLSYIAPLMYSKDSLTRLIPDLADKGHPPPKLPECSNWDDIHGMMTADTLIYLPQDILLKVDRASMAHSVEVRSPFVDHDVVEFALSLPTSWHRSNFTGKRMLNKAFHELLPAVLWRRRKQGFASPVHAWFRKGLDKRLEDMLQIMQTPLNKKFVQRLIAEHRSCRRDHGYRLWGIYIYLLWRQRLQP